MLLKEMLEEYQNDVAYNLPFGEVTLTGAGKSILKLELNT